MNNTIYKVIAGVIAAGVLAGCATPKVRVDTPPKFDVSRYPVYGIVQMTSTGERNLGQLSTQRFMQAMQGSRTGTSIVELGSESAVLAAVGRSRLDPEAVRLIGDKYKIDALITGILEVSKEKMNVKVDLDLSALKAKSQVRVSLTGKIFETSRGATVWSDTSFGTWNMAGISGGTTGLRTVNVVTDREGKYADIVTDLANVVTRDFRPTYTWQKVQK